MVIRAKSWCSAVISEKEMGKSEATRLDITEDRLPEVGDRLKNVEQKMFGLLRSQHILEMKIDKRLEDMSKLIRELAKELGMNYDKEREAGESPFVLSAMENRCSMAVSQFYFKMFHPSAPFSSNLSEAPLLEKLDLDPRNIKEVRSAQLSTDEFNCWNEILVCEVEKGYWKKLTSSKEHSLSGAQKVFEKMPEQIEGDKEIADVETFLLQEEIINTFDGEVQNIRLEHPHPLPSILQGSFNVDGGPPSSAAGNPDEIAKLFPGLFGQPLASLVPGNGNLSGQGLKIGVVLSGGQAPVGHNVISGISDYLQDCCKGSMLYGFRGVPVETMKGKYVVLTSNYIYPYNNPGAFGIICSGRDKIETPEQFKQAAEMTVKLDLDGLVVIGGDDSNTNACLAEIFRSKNLKTSVIGCPKTKDGDLKCKEVPTSFGFGTKGKIYAERIVNVMVDTRSTGKYYHFVRLMGRATSHITSECALQTHPHITLIGEDVAEKRQTLKKVTDYIADVISKSAEVGYNYGVILIPEGLIDFIPELQQLIAELNEILAHEVVDEDGVWKKKFSS